MSRIITISFLFLALFFYSCKEQEHNEVKTTAIEIAELHCKWMEIDKKLSEKSSVEEKEQLAKQLEKIEVKIWELQKDMYDTYSETDLEEFIKYFDKEIMNCNNND